MTREIVVRTPGDDTDRRTGIPIERQVTLFANGTEIATVQATPEDLDELAVGFLVSERVISGPEVLGDIEIDAHRGLVFVSAAEEIVSRPYPPRTLLHIRLRQGHDVRLPR